ncbi:MAG TPA: hypothetical protein VFF73_09520 [Planctomycetota bacterium]|nr:hypothetical protein [Planctomycetota bacterium]
MVAALLLACALPAFAGDAGVARRKVMAAENARDAAEAEENLKEAEAELEGLDDATKAEIRASIDACRKNLAAQKIASALKSVDGTLDRTESMFGDGDRRDDSLIQRNFGIVAERLAELPQDDPGVKAALARLAKLRAAHEGLGKKESRDKTVGLALRIWKKIQIGDEWKSDEATTPATKFLSGQYANAGCERSLRVVEELTGFLENEKVRKALADFPDDPELKAAADRARKTRLEAATKACQVLAKLMDELDSVEPTSEGERLGHILAVPERAKSATGAPEQPATLARAEALAKKWRDRLEGNKAAASELQKKIAESCGPFWQENTKDFSGFVEIDPADCLKNLDKWKGKRVRFTNLDNHLKGEYWDDSTLGFVVHVNGMPVALVQDPGLTDAIRAAQKAGNVSLSPWPYTVEDAIGVIEGKCVLQGRVYSQLTKQESRTGLTYEAPLVRITSLKQESLAFVEGKGTNLSTIPGLPPVPVEVRGGAGGASGSSSGVGWLFVLLGGLCFFGTLVAMAGAAVLYLKMKKDERPEKP